MMILTEADIKDTIKEAIKDEGWKTSSISIEERPFSGTITAIAIIHRYGQRYGFQIVVTESFLSQCKDSDEAKMYIRDEAEGRLHKALNVERDTLRINGHTLQILETEERFEAEAVEVEKTWKIEPHERSWSSSPHCVHGGLRNKLSEEELSTMRSYVIGWAASHNIGDYLAQHRLYNS